MSTNRLASRMRTQSNLTKTENDAMTHRSTLNPVLDFFYLAPSRQGQDNTDLFHSAYMEDMTLALKAAFYLRDVRGGKGQRKTFRDILAYLAEREKSVFNAVVPYVAEYGRWDDLLPFVNHKSVQNVVRRQLEHDTVSTKTISLLGKWLPSENASSQQTKELARLWMDVLGLSPREYRKMLTALRMQIGVVENYMSHQAWDDVPYSRVPSRAMKLYRKAFERHDEERFSSFIEKAIKGEVKIQSKTLYPHEIVAPFLHGSSVDKVLEAQWNQLPNYFGDDERNVLVVVDTSGSMFATISGNVQAIDVSIGLGLYCAERNRGAFHNLVLTFNSNSHLVEIDGKSLLGRVRKMKELPWGGSTNVQSAFQSILRLAKEEGVEADEMPTNVIIISDMEFNSCCELTNLDAIKKQYQSAGYEMPGLTFWNVNARGNQAPATKHEKGVFLVGGFSAETIGKVLNAQATNPEELMLEVLNSERYAFVDNLEL
jgi:hypothetical protein